MVGMSRRCLLAIPGCFRHIIKSNHKEVVRLRDDGDDIDIHTWMMLCHFTIEIWDETCNTYRLFSYDCILYCQQQDRGKVQTVNDYVSF
jgi:hypothetical protein